MQFGHALLRIFQQIARSDPRLGPVLLSKIDIMDTFYRVGIRADDVPKLGIIFPAQTEEEPWIGLLLVLPMGCKQSPPLITATTENAADLTNARLLANDGSYHHRLELVSESPVKLITPLPTMVAGPQSSPIPPLW
jgi:hypothetical protein